MLYIVSNKIFLLNAFIKVKIKLESHEMMYRFRKYILLMLCFLITSCSSTIKTDFESFSNIDSAYNSKKFFIIKDKWQTGSAEFDDYASSVSNRLIHVSNWQRVYSKKKADYIISLKYSTQEKDNASQPSDYIRFTEVDSYGDDDFFSKTTTSQSIYIPLDNNNYKHVFKLKIKKNRSNKSIYEAKSISNNGHSMFSKVSECMIASALKDFPNERKGKESLAQEDCNKY